MTLDSRVMIGGTGESRSPAFRRSLSGTHAVSRLLTKLRVHHGLPIATMLEVRIIMSPDDLGAVRGPGVMMPHQDGAVPAGLMPVCCVLWLCGRVALLCVGGLKDPKRRPDHEK